MDKIRHVQMMVEEEKDGSTLSVIKMRGQLEGKMPSMHFFANQGPMHGYMAMHE